MEVILKSEAHEEAENVMKVNDAKKRVDSNSDADIENTNVAMDAESTKDAESAKDAMNDNVPTKTAVDPKDNAENKDAEVKAAATETNETTIEEGSCRRIQR